MSFLQTHQHFVMPMLLILSGLLLGLVVVQFDPGRNLPDCANALTPLFTDPQAQSSYFECLEPIAKARYSSPETWLDEFRQRHNIPLPRNAKLEYFDKSASGAWMVHYVLDFGSPPPKRVVAYFDNNKLSYILGD